MVFVKNPQPAKFFLDFPIVGPKKSWRKLKLWVSKPIRKKYKTNEKRISSIRHTSEEKNPKNHPKIAYFRKVVFSDGFWDFSQKFQNFHMGSLIMDHNKGIGG